MDVESVLSRPSGPGPKTPGTGTRARPGAGRRIRAAVLGVLPGSGAVAAALLALAAAGALIGEPVLLPSLAASAAVLHHTPGLPAAQPRTLVLAHLLGAASGYAVLAVVPGSPWGAAVAAGLTFAATSLARAAHSPACATAVVVVLQDPVPVRFVPLLLGATVVLVLGGYTASRLRRAAPPYPVRWW